MKKLHKALMGVTALVMAFSVAAVAGCGDTGEIKGNYQEATPEKGNYQEATPEKVEETLKEVEADKIFGDSTQENYKFGLKFSTDLTASYTAGEDSASGKVKAGLKIVEQGKDGKNVAGSGTASVEYKAKITNNALLGNVDVDEKYTATAYVDAEYLYGSYIHNEEPEAGAKVSVAALMAAVAPVAPAPQADASAGMEMAGSLNIADLLQLAKTYKIKLGLDTGNGIKLKMSVTEESFWAILTATAGAEVAAMKQFVKFNTMKLDVYFALDSNNLFSGASVVVDIDAVYDVTTGLTDEQKAQLGENLPAATKVQIKGNIQLKNYTKDAPALPEGLKTDAKYVDCSEAIGGLIGGGSMGYEPAV